MQLHKQSESCEGELSSNLDLFFYKIKLKMGDYPGSGYKMSSYGLKVYNPQETVGQWAQCCKVYSITHARRINLHFMWFVLLAVSLTKLSFYVSARRCDQKEPYCHNRRRRCSWYMESGETEVFRSFSRHQLFSCQDHGTFKLSAIVILCLFVNPVVFAFGKNFMFRCRVYL